MPDNALIRKLRFNKIGDLYGKSFNNAVPLGTFNPSRSVFLESNVKCPTMP